MEPTLEMPVEAVSQTVETAPAAKAVRVLAIDDNEEFHSVLKQLLEPAGYVLETFTNPVKALEVFTHDKDKFDLVLLDFYMPALDGSKTFEWLRKLNPNIKVIICSGADEMRLRQLQAQHAIDGYIHKPFRLQEALFVINKVMSKSARR
jgi:CheY-like chemotaxis protein